MKNNRNISFKAYEEKKLEILEEENNMFSQILRLN